MNQLRLKYGRGEGGQRHDWYRQRRWWERRRESEEERQGRILGVSHTIRLKLTTWHVKEALIYSITTVGSWLLREVRILESKRGKELAYLEKKGRGRRNWKQLTGSPLLPETVLFGCTDTVASVARRNFYGGGGGGGVLKDFVLLEKSTEPKKGKP
jgi:hypothetical protein